MISVFFHDETTRKQEGAGRASTDGPSDDDDIFRQVALSASHNNLIGDPLTSADGVNGNIKGTLGANILVGGYTEFDVNQIALTKLLSEWSRTDLNYAARVDHLRAADLGGNNGAYSLDGTTVHDNSALDQPFGGPHDDWYLAHAGGGIVDSITGKVASEELDII